MKRAILIGCFAVFTTLVSAQKIYFIYLQTETGEPFFIRMNDKLYSSTGSGYLILSRLRDSTYNFRLGFPGKDIDLDFTCPINKKDHGYLIKNLGEKGWGLFDLQTLGLQMSPSNSKHTSGSDHSTGSSAQINAFTDMLSKAVDDPSLRQNPVFMTEKTDVVRVVQNDEKNDVITEAVVKEAGKSEVVSRSPEKLNQMKFDSVSTNPGVDSSEKSPLTPAGEVYTSSQVRKISGVTTTEGFESVFIDEYPQGNKDTIRILIPAKNHEAVIKREEKPDSTKEAKIFLDFSSDTVQEDNVSRVEAKKEETKKWWPFSRNKDAEANKTESEEKKDATPKTGIVNSTKKPSSDKSDREPKNGESKKRSFFNHRNKTDTTAIKKCQVVASNDDFLKLRRKMAGRTNDDGMLEEAKKYFREKCFTTEQIKNLASMFLSNAGKYNFFNTAYNYVSDTEHFPSLESELKDEYYINRFKEMLHN